MYQAVTITIDNDDHDNQPPSQRCSQPCGDTAAVHRHDRTPGMLYCIRQTVLTVTIDNDNHDNQPRGNTPAMHSGDHAPGMLYCIRRTILTIITIDNSDRDNQASRQMCLQPRGDTTATHSGGLCREICYITLDNNNSIVWW